MMSLAGPSQPLTMVAPANAFSGEAGRYPHLPQCICCLCCNIYNCIYIMCSEVVPCGICWWGGSSSWTKCGSTSHGRDAAWQHLSQVHLPRSPSIACSRCSDSCSPVPRTIPGCLFTPCCLATMFPIPSTYRPGLGSTILHVVFC